MNYLWGFMITAGIVYAAFNGTLPEVTQAAVDSSKEAVTLCAEKARPGDAVLLSPACASWGMFDNYEQRGRMFKEYVRELSCVLR